MIIVSVIVPCYNQAIYLDECLSSLIKQSLKNWECIIVNDGSTDNTIEIATKWCQKDTRFKLINCLNGGVSKARNIGIKETTAKYILPLDADDYISDNYLEVCVNELEKNSNLKLVYGQAYKFGEVNEQWDLYPYSFSSLLKYNMIFCTALFSRVNFNKTKGYDESMLLSSEDWEFWISLMKDGGEVLSSNKCKFYYRIKIESRNSNIHFDEKKYNLARNYIFSKHTDLYGFNNAIDLYESHQNLFDKWNNPALHLSMKTVINIFFKKINKKITSIIRYKN